MRRRLAVLVHRVAAWIHPGPDIRERPIVAFIESPTFVGQFYEFTQRGNRYRIETLSCDKPK